LKARETPPKIPQVSGGEFHSLALAASGAIYAFGGGDEGQLGVGRSRYSALPQLLPHLEGVASYNQGHLYKHWQRKRK
jgi:alpha-tubulin suppressor-like RCC1 family protein